MERAYDVSVLELEGDTFDPPKADEAEPLVASSVEVDLRGIVFLYGLRPEHLHSLVAEDSDHGEMGDDDHVVIPPFAEPTRDLARVVEGVWLLFNYLLELKIKKRHFSMTTF